MKNYLFLFLLILSSCKLTSNTYYSKSLNSNSEELFTDKTKIISLEKTACFGTCPIFTINIFNNGEVIYYGKKFVKKLGNLNFELNQKEINQILNKAKEINFNNLKSEYTENISDLPTTYVTINKKTIKNYFGAPKELKDLEKLIESIILEKMNIESF